jgi:hypothetical protein
MFERTLSLYGGNAGKREGLSATPEKQLTSIIRPRGRKHLARTSVSQVLSPSRRHSICNRSILWETAGFIVLLTYDLSDHPETAYPLAGSGFCLLLCP